MEIRIKRRSVGLVSGTQIYRIKKRDAVRGQRTAGKKKGVNAAARTWGN